MENEIVDTISYLTGSYDTLTATMNELTKMEDSRVTRRFMIGYLERFRSKVENQLNEVKEI